MVLIFERSLNPRVRAVAARTETQQYSRVVHVDIYFLIPRVSLGGHHVLDIVQKRIKAFIYDHARLFLILLELLILILLMTISFISFPPQAIDPPSLSYFP
jgi:hypothetical protein